MEFTYLESFIKIAEYNSFSKAAVSLGYTQSAISIQMSKLEKELGVSLFERMGKQIYLTQHGERFLQYAIETIQNEHLIKQTLTDDTSVNGTISIAVAHSLCSSEFSSVLMKYHKRFPDVKVIVKSGITNDYINWIDHNEVDLIYTLDQPLNKPSCTTNIESEINIGFFTHFQHPLANKQNLTINDINQYPLFLTEEGLSYRLLLEEHLARYKLFLSPSIEIGDTDIIRKLILDNPSGIGFIPEFIVKNELANHRVIPLSVKHTGIKMYKQILYHKNKLLTPALQELISMICTYSS